MKNILNNLLGLALIAGAIVLVGNVAVAAWTKAKEKELANEARYQCALSSRYETVDQSGAKVIYPVPQLYTMCMSEKGMEK